MSMSNCQQCPIDVAIELLAYSSCNLHYVAYCDVLNLDIVEVDVQGLFKDCTALHVEKKNSTWKEGGDCIQSNGNGGSTRRNSNGNQTAASSNNDSLTMTEHQVAKLMEEDMGSAMQYLQGKGLCLMPISLATAISTATCHSRNPLINHGQNSTHNNPLIASNGDGPSSPSMSVLTVQSANLMNGGGDSSVKDAASVSKPRVIINGVDSLLVC